MNEGSLRQAGDVGPLFHWRTGAVEVTGLACRAAPGGLRWSLQVMGEVAPAELPG